MLLSDTKLTYFGHVSRYDTDRHFGFIETEDNTYFFFFDKKEQIQLKKSGVIDRIHKFSSGDEVEFQLRPSIKDSSRLEAYNIKFIRNLRRQKLVEEAKEKDILLGYLKQVDNEKLFVKHKTTYVFVPLKISEWETDLEAVYFDRIDKLVEFRLTQTEKLDKLCAVLTDRKFSKEYQMITELMQSEQATEAKITGRNIHGLFATVFNGTLNGFVTLSKEPTPGEQEIFQKLRKGDDALVKLKHHPDTKNLFLKLADK